MNQAPDNQPEEETGNWGLSLRKTIDKGRTFYRYKFWEIAEGSETETVDEHFLSEELFGHLRILGDYFNGMSAFEMYDILAKLYTECLERGDRFTFPHKTIGEQIEDIQLYLDNHPACYVLHEEVPDDQIFEDANEELRSESDAEDQ